MTNGRAVEILRRLGESYNGRLGTRLNFESPYQLLIATVLSAQCTDEKVNEVIPKLFQRFQTPEQFAQADVNKLEALIRPTGFYRVKARRIKEISATLVDKYGSTVPRTMGELLELKGVARKTANIILTNGFGIVEGIAVDTHVMRLAKRLGLSGGKTREKIEQDLLQIFPRQSWSTVNSLFIEHGRRICQARKPKCTECVLLDLCPSGPSFTRALG